MLDFIYYPVSFILWCWHKVFGFVFGPDNAISWILGIVFLTFTIRGILFKPFVKQVRSMRKMQDFAPEVKKIQKKYGNDKQRQAQEMQRLQREQGVNPLGSCLPMLLQIPVFIGLNHVLRMFAPGRESNYFFDAGGVESYVNAKFFGVNLGDAINHIGALAGGQAAAEPGLHWDVAPVAIPLMIVAAVATHFTARHSVARQNPAQATAQTAMMNKLTLWVFPIGVLVFGAFFPLGLLIYFLANNTWTLGQQRLVYTWIDREEEEKKAAEKEKRSSLGPKPGQKPANKPQPGQKPGKKSAQQKGDTQVSDSSSAADSAGVDETTGTEDADTREPSGAGGTGKTTEKAGGSKTATTAKGTAKGSSTSQKRPGSTDAGATTSAAAKGKAGTQTSKNGKSPKGGSNVKGGAWAKNGGNQQGSSGQRKKSQSRKRR